ncbi:MAG: phosphodiester glycosidase family protein [Clostridia bacterium]|nr:phosphodiester glycosidase family protein [Clostridia bacterium]
MKNTKFIKVMALVLSVVMLLGMIPVGAFAAETEFVSETHDVFSSTTSTIAPGVTQSINYAYSKDGKQMVYYVATADVTRDDVVVQTSYKEQYVNSNFGMEKLTNQIAFADKLYTDPTSDRFISENYKVVAGVNASFYNMTTGQPSGVTYLDGIRIGESASYNQIFAVKKDGSVYIEYTKNLEDADYDEIWQAVAGSQMLVYEGRDVTKNINGSYNTDRHSRTCVGVTADGKVVVMSLDGRQEPFSCGGTMHELAQIMLEQGCVTAINLDGGGSTTFAARQEGENDVTIVNRPSDGSERSISAGLIIASLAAPSDKFDRAVLTAENTYVTPGSTVKVTAAGVSPAGTAAPIPEDVDWQLADSKYGTVENGVFVSNGTVGAVEIQMTYGGAVVGSTIVNVVIPDTLKFNNSSVTVPYGKTVKIGLTATFGLNEVALKDSDIAFTLSNTAIGSFDGLSFTAGAEGIAASTSEVTAAFTFASEITATATLKLGKGSQVIFDFENGTTGGLVFSEPAGTQYNYVWPESNQWVVTAEEGKVHSGNYAMKAWVNYSNSLESGYQKTSLVGPTVPMIFENATRVGMWIYVPEEAVGVWARWTIQGATEKDANGDYKWSGVTGQDMDDTAGGTGVISTFQESGWHYLSIDTSAYTAIRLHSGAIMQFYISDRDGSAYGYDASDYSNITGNFTFYIDDITIDYSEAVDDRDAPKFSSVVYADEFTNDAPELNGQTTKSNVLSFTATVADKVAANATGLNPASAKAYIDGVAVDFTYSDGKIAITDVKLADGKHTVKFTICDNMGNYSSVIREIIVNAGSDIATVKMVPHDATLDRILHGSIYYIDLVATDIDTAKSVAFSIDLDSLSTWQLDHMDLAEGFTATYSIDADDNIATVVITRTGAVVAEGEAVLASIPVRVWQLKTGYTYPNGTQAGKPAFTSKQFRDKKEFWRISLIADVEFGQLTNLDDTTTSFTSNGIFVDTEMWAEDADMIATEAGLAYYNNWNGGHVHSAHAVDDLDATCDTAGYTGRTFCDVCNSVVDWGTTIPATGHTYSLVDGEFKCVDCDADLGNYTGMVYDDIAEVYRYLMFGQVSAGWFMVNNEWVYIIPETFAAAQGSVTTTDGITFDFVDGKVQGHVWEDWYVYKRCWYGPDYYKNTSKNVKYLMVELDGEIYFFNSAGCMQKGLVVSHESNKFDFFCYDCGTDGKGVPYTGVAEDMYFENGLQQMGLRLVKVEENHYFITASNRLASNCTVELGSELTGLVFADGNVYFVENGVAVAKGLVQDAEGNFYFINSTKKAVENTWYAFSASGTNGLNVKPGRYYFDANGKMVDPIIEEEPEIPVVKEGLVFEENGDIQFYENGVAVAKGLVQDAEGNYYFINSTKKAVKNTWYAFAVSGTNGLDVKPGRYFFEADGKMVIPEPEEPETPVVKEGLVFEKNGDIRFYENGVAVAKGLVQDAEGNYYFINSTKKAVKNTWYAFAVSGTNGLDVKPGRYFFEADGKMVLN